MTAATVCARRAPIVAAALLTALTPLSAQDGCVTQGSYLAALGGAVRVEVAGGRTIGGFEAGIEAGTDLGAVHLSGDATYAGLEDASGNPAVLRLRAARALAEVVGVTVCGAVLGGGSVISAADDRAWTAAGGVALSVGRTLGPPGARVTPYVGVRGLGGQAGGEILGEDLVASGASLGVEGGVAAARGRFAGALRATADGFDPGLGPTPYPALAVRLVLGWRF